MPTRRREQLQAVRRKNLWTAPIDAGLDESSKSSAPAGGRAGIVTGLLVSLSNPKALIFVSAVVPSILPVGHLSVADFALLIACSSLQFLIVFGGWALLAAKARAMLSNAVRRRTFNRGSAVLIAASAAAVATR
jgi:threonine/homoserine/homoserine lactone efflux protein